jgi:hypothetical protein
MEVVVVDDASSDRTEQVVRSFSATRYIRLPTNAGSAAARNAGIRASTGEYVAFLDDDDLSLPYRLSLQVPALEAAPEAGVLYSQYIDWHKGRAHIWPPSPSPSGMVFRQLLLTNFMASANALVRRDALERVGHFDETLPTAEDYDLWLRLAFYVPFRFQPGPVTIVRHPDSGKSLSHLAAGTKNRFVHLVVERALALIADSQDFPRFSRQVRARGGLRGVNLAAWLGDSGQLRTELLRALRETPFLIRDPWARSALAWHALQLVAESETPIEAARALSAELRSVVNGRGVREAYGMRRVLAELWKGLARELAEQPTPQYREAASAALLAIRFHPAVFGRTLLGILLRGPRPPRSRR